MSTKKVIIPKGTLNPRQTSVIEIPTNLQDSSVVVARNNTSSSGGGSGGSSSGGYRAANQFGSSGSGSSGGYMGAGQFSGGGGLSPPPCVPECYQANQPGGEQPLDYKDFRHDLHERGGGITSSPFAALEYEDEQEDPEFEESIAEQMGLLSNLEFVEYDQLMDDLNTFQRCRRRLEQDLSNMGCKGS